MMRNWIIGAVIVIVTAALGVGAAYGAKTVLQQNAPSIRSAIQNSRGVTGQQYPNWQQNPGQNSQNPFGNQQQNTGPNSQNRFRPQTTTTASMTMDQAVQQAQAYAQKSGSDWKIDKVLEFQNAFDAIFVENGTGRGAAQLIIPKNGRMLQTSPEMRWNLKYGSAGESRSSTAGASDNSVSVSDASTAAQTYLAKVQPSATLNAGGYSFYGYYLFEYSVDGKTAGIVLVNGLNSQVAQLRQLGAFLSEKEMSQ